MRIWAAFVGDNDGNAMLQGVYLDKLIGKIYGSSEKTYCNPLGLAYRYQHINEGGRCSEAREGADPTLIQFKRACFRISSLLCLAIENSFCAI